MTPTFKQHNLGGVTRLKMAKARHKWKKEVETEYGTKPHKCVKCGVRKFWRGGDYQAWEYYWNTCSKAMDGSDYWQIHETWQRPECVGLTQQRTSAE